MSPDFLVEEVTIRESGESAVFDASNQPTGDLLFTLGITHAVEQERIGVDILGSNDGVTWTAGPVASFTPKSYCGTYKMVAPASGNRYLKAVWKPERWSRRDNRPFFRMYIQAEPHRGKTRSATA
jgi:hypothetical protein